MRTIQKGFTLIEFDDRGCDHRHSGCGGAPRVPGLHRPGEDVRGDPGSKRMPHLDYRGVPDRRHAASREQLGLREHDRRSSKYVNKIQTDTNGKVSVLIATGIQDRR